MKLDMRDIISYISGAIGTIIGMFHFIVVQLLPANPDLESINKLISISGGIGGLILIYYSVRHLRIKIKATREQKEYYKNENKKHDQQGQNGSN